MTRKKSESREEAELALKLLDSFQEHGVSLPTRTVYFGGEEDVGHEASARFIKNMHVLESLNHEPVRVIVNSPGGDVYHGLAVVDSIMRSPCEVICTVRGHAMSMGSIVLQAASRRIMGPNATQMLHYGYASGDAHAKTFIKWAEEEKRLNDRFEQLYWHRMRDKNKNVPLSLVQEMLDHDTILDATNSIRLGLCDEIG